VWSVISRGDGNVSIQPMTSLLIVTSLDNAPQINKRRCCRRCRRLWSGTRPGQGAPRTGSKLINGAGWTARRQQVNRRRALTRPYTTRQLKLPRIVPSLSTTSLHPVFTWCDVARLEIEYLFTRVIAVYGDAETLNERTSSLAGSRPGSNRLDLPRSRPLCSRCQTSNTKLLILLCRTHSQTVRGVLMWI